MPKKKYSTQFFPKLEYYDSNCKKHLNGINSDGLLEN